MCGMSPAGPARGEDAAATRCRNSAAKSPTKPAKEAQYRPKEAYGHKVCAARGESKHIEREKERRERGGGAEKEREKERGSPLATTHAWPEVLVHPLTHAGI